ncbi:Epidermal retinol dehydrogenase 2-like 4 [Homarus americanus]|uniref:Epidermal retinol dehydrogenase 2-like 4 n=1 Tax=Homarus americanus TaxID=6706 RepID=A0A8J5JKI8_HOMAM|nr:Epidermal retinol dehydrogenase 2-like 4 [Homarus americanus]
MFLDFDKMIGIIMIVYQYVLLMCDFVHLVVIAAFLTAKSMWYLLFPPPMKSVTGEIILVTGAGHGIGRELGLQFARMGAKVVCLDINEANNTKTVTDIKREGGNAWGYKCDVSSQEEVQEVSRKTLQEWLPSFLAAGRGHVVAVSSIAGLMATSNIVPYCSSKFPSFNPITTPETCAAKIIEGVCREEEVVCIPSRDYYGHIIMGLLPREVRKAFLDFMDTGVDEDC